MPIVEHLEKEIYIEARRDETVLFVCRTTYALMEYTPPVAARKSSYRDTSINSATPWKGYIGREGGYTGCQGDIGYEEIKAHCLGKFPFYLQIGKEANVTARRTAGGCGAGKQLR